MTTASLAETGQRQTQDYPVPSWFRFVLRFRSPWRLAACVAGLYLAAALAWYNLIGAFEGLRLDGHPFWLHSMGSLELSYACYFGWVPVAIAYLVRGADRDLTRASRVLRLSGTGLASARRELLAVPARALWLGAGVGVVLAILTMLVASPFGRGLLPLQIVWLILREHLIDIGIFSVVAWGVVVARRLSRLARERASVALLDPDAFAPFVHNGMRLALLWLLMWAIQVPWIFFVSMEGFIGSGGVSSLTVLFGVGVALTAIGVALPTSGVRDRIRAAKRDELARVRVAIDEARAAALAEAPSSDAAARLPGLLAYERRIEDVAEWPIDAPMLRRLGLYLLIPVASWVGGALVERFVDVALG